MSALDNLKKLAALGGDEADLSDPAVRATVLRDPWLYERFRSRLLSGDLSRKPTKDDRPPAASIEEAKARRLREVTSNLQSYEQVRSHLLETGELPPGDADDDA
jgi:hypothetical protein